MTDPATGVDFPAQMKFWDSVLFDCLGAGVRKKRIAGAIAVKVYAIGIYAEANKAASELVSKAGDLAAGGESAYCDAIRNGNFDKVGMRRACWHPHLRHVDVNTSTAFFVRHSVIPPGRAFPLSPSVAAYSASSTRFRVGLGPQVMQLELVRDVAGDTFSKAIKDALEKEMKKAGEEDKLRQFEEFFAVRTPARLVALEMAPHECTCSLEYLT